MIAAIVRLGAGALGALCLFVAFIHALIVLDDVYAAPNALIFGVIGVLLVRYALGKSWIVPRPPEGPIDKPNGKPLALLLLAALPVAAQAPAFDDSGVRVYYEPQNLWRDAEGRFTGRRENGKLVLLYDFFDQRDRHACPENTGGRENSPTCEQVQDAVGRAIEMWGEASGRLVLRRRSGPGTVNLWIAWTRRFDEGSPVARAFDRGPDGSETRLKADESFRGFGRVAYPGERKTSAGLFFNDKFCWHLEDPSTCPSPAPLPNGKVPEHKHDARKVALHEAGHVLGFGHFTVSSIMGVSGGSERYELTPYDREAVRILYERVDASVP